MKYLIFPLIALVFFACNNEPSKTEATAQALPTTPEATARLWQQYVDSDRFAEAAAISTPRAQEWLLMIEKFLEGLPPEETAEPVVTIFKEFNCIEEHNAARCGYIIEEEGERIRDTFFLFKTDGQWKVDIPEDLTEEEEVNMKELIDSIIQQDLQQ